MFENNEITDYFFEFSNYIYNYLRDQLKSELNS